jgi:chemotaxis protein MotB
VKPKYLQAETGNRDRWTVSYMDMLTILLIFFIAVAARLPAHPPVSPPSLSVPAAAVAAPIPVPAPVAPERPVLSNAQQILEKHGLDVKLERRGLVISLPQTILFASGDDRISASALPIVEEIADVLRDVPNKVSLIGHADSIPIHNRRFKNNWELSAARGLRLLETLNTRFGIPESRLSVSSDGANRPKSSNETPDGRAENRRVEIVILDEAAQ